MQNDRAILSKLRLLMDKAGKLCCSMAISSLCPEVQKKEWSKRSIESHDTDHASYRHSLTLAPADSRPPGIQ